MCEPTCLCKLGSTKMEGLSVLSNATSNPFFGFHNHGLGASQAFNANILKLH